MKTDRERDGWVGPVRSVVVESGPIPDESGEDVVTVRQFDFKITYNRDGRRTSESDGFNMLAAPPARDSIIREDSDGNIIEYEQHEHDILKYKTIFTYDAEGREIKRATYDSNGVLLNSWVHEYSERGQAVGLTIYRGDGSLVSKQTYVHEYDVVSNVTKTTHGSWTSVDGKLTYEPEFVTYYTITYY